MSQDFPRGCIFIGIDQLDRVLTDSTGNRRFWPVKVGEIDLRHCAWMWAALGRSRGATEQARSGGSTWTREAGRRRAGASRRDRPLGRAGAECGDRDPKGEPLRKVRRAWHLEQETYPRTVHHQRDPEGAQRANRTARQARGNPRRHCASGGRMDRQGGASSSAA